jgi:hypothetical protein
MRRDRTGGAPARSKGPLALATAPEYRPQRRMKALQSLFVGAALFVAVEGSARGEDRAGEPATRSIWVAPTYQALLTSTFEPSSRHGLGARGSYEFHITPVFNIGLVLAYRLYPGSSSTQQLGYGALLKHFFSAEWSAEDGVYPYLDYGLLLQQTFVEARTGSAISHDTRLGAGAVIRRWGLPLFIGVAAHYSRLQYFDVEARGIPYLEFEIGLAPGF